MTSYSFDRVAVEIGAPVEVGRRTGHFWFASLHPFNERDIVCLVTLTDDKAQGQWPGALYLTRDGGATWKWSTDIACCGPASTTGGPDRRLLLPYELWPLEPNDRRNLSADGTLLTLNADGSISQAATPMRFLDFPFDFADYHLGELALVTNGNILPMTDGRLMTTLYGTLRGEKRYRLFAVASDDGGFTWHYLAVVASWEDVPGRPEGPCESHTARLADGRLLCIYRVGSGRQHPFHKSYSTDDGAAWTRPAEVVDAWSVEPQLIRLPNGLLLLSGGRYGLCLWVCADGEGNAWHTINLAEHHNASLSDTSLHYDPAFCDAREDVMPAQSTSYTGMIQTGPDEVLICYDRLANGWNGAPGPWGDEDQVYCVRVKARDGKA